MTTDVRRIESKLRRIVAASECRGPTARRITSREPHPVNIECCRERNSMGPAGHLR